MTTIEPGPPGGVERRREQLDINALREEVHNLEEAVHTLAPAVTRILPDQIQVGVAELRRLFIQVVAAILLGVLVLIAYSQVAVNHLNRRVDKGHQIITCFLQVPEASRDATHLLTCQQQYQ